MGKSKQEFIKLKEELEFTSQEKTPAKETTRASELNQELHDLISTFAMNLAEQKSQHFCEMRGIRYLDENGDTTPQGNDIFSVTYKYAEKETYDFAKEVIRLTGKINLELLKLDPSTK